MFDFSGGGGGGFGGGGIYPASDWTFYAVTPDVSTPNGQAGGGSTGGSTSPGQSSGGGFWENLYKILGIGLGGYSIYSQNQLANKAIKYQTGLSYNPQGQLLGVGSGAAGSGLSGLIPVAIIALIAIIALSLVFKAIR